MEVAWNIIANAGGGDWEQETKEWQSAANRWRDEYFKSRPFVYYSPPKCYKCDESLEGSIIYTVEIIDGERKPRHYVRCPKQSMGDPRLHALLKEIGELHDKKQKDYGREGDPFANVRASTEFGVPAWVGTMIRANDKMHRVKAFAQRGSLANESVEDSLMDLAVYALIALILYREQANNLQ